MQSDIRHTATAGALLAVFCLVFACAHAQGRPAVATMRPEPTRVETRAPMVERRATSGTEVALEQAIGRNERLITRRRSELQSSMILRDALVERHIPMSQVIAVSATPDASRATIYYRPQE